MGLGAAAYARMLLALLPPGKLWRRDPDGKTYAVMLGAGDELERVDGRGFDLIRESEADQADQLLEEYESELDLSSDGTDDERRARIVARLIARQRVRPVDFQEALAPLLGLDADDIAVIERDRAFAILVEDDTAIYMFFIYRDPDLPGTYDVDAAQELVDSIAHSHTKGVVIESIDFLCDDEFSLCDRDLLGA